MVHHGTVSLPALGKDRTTAYQADTPWALIWQFMTG